MDPRKIAWAGELKLLEAKWTDKDGHTVRFKIQSPNEEKPNPFKAFTKRRGGRAGTRFRAAVTAVDTQSVAYDGEFMLAGWGDTSTQGYTVTFWCEHPEPGKMHPFAGYERTVATFMAALVELGDDDAAIDQKAREIVEQATSQKPRRTQLLSTVAAMMCQQAEFQRWCRVDSTEEAAALMRTNLGVQSRRALDHDQQVATRFHNEIRKPYLSWLEEETYHGRVPESV